MSDSRMFLRLLSWLKRDPSEDRRPKHPRPSSPPCPQVPRPKPIDVGRPPRGGSGVLPAPPPDCPTCEVGRVERIHHAQEEQGKAFIIERFHCVACSKVFTMEDVAKAKGMKKGPPKMPDPADDPEPRIEEDYGATMRAYRDERRRSGGVPMYPDDSDAEEKKDLNQITTEKGWRKPKSEKARETSSAWWWTAIKWTIGVGASIGLGWLAEWAFF